MVLEVGGGQTCLAGVALACTTACAQVHLTDGNERAVQSTVSTLLCSVVYSTFSLLCLASFVRRLGILYNLLFLCHCGYFGKLINSDSHAYEIEVVYAPEV